MITTILRSSALNGLVRPALGRRAGFGSVGAFDEATPTILQWYRGIASSSGGGSGRDGLRADSTVKVHVSLREEDLEESFVKGWGKGGQKINKVRNCVLLKHLPTGLHVRCQETRSLDGNRKIARRLLLQKLDDQVNGALSKRNVKIDKLRKKKANRRSKSKQKYAAHKAVPSEDENEDEDEDDEGEDECEDEDDEDIDIVVFDVDEHKFKSSRRRK